MISANRKDMDRLKQEFPELNISHAKNVMEFTQLAGPQKVDAMVFLSDSAIKDFHALHTYLRSKPNFRDVPIAVLTRKLGIFPVPISDTSVRNFAAEGGLFLPLLEFFEKIEKKGSFHAMMTSDFLMTAFARSLSEHIGNHPDFTASPACDDDLHAEFQAQLSDEIATNLLWIKFSARILLRNSESLAQLLAQMTETEAQAYQEQILNLTFKKFTEDLWKNLRADGATQFVASMEMAPQYRLPYMKAAQNSGLVFKSDYCHVLLEISRYI